MATSPRSPEPAWGEGPASLFAALGDPTRIRLLVRLSRDGPQSITQLTVGTGITRQAVTRHLHVLAGSGLARSQRSGRDQLWTLDPAHLNPARRWLDLIGSRWEAALRRLKSTLEQD